MARFIKRDHNRTSSVTEMIQSLDLDLLKDRCEAHRLNTFYSAVNNLIALPIPDYFLLKQRFTRSFSNDSFIQANCNHYYYFYSLYPRTIRDWNLFTSGHLHCFSTTNQNRPSSGSFESRSFCQAMRSKERRLEVRDWPGS